MKIDNLRPLHGYAVAFNGPEPGQPPLVRILDASRVLYPESIVKPDDGKPSRFQFVEYFGNGLAPAHCRHVLGDVFCASHETARFVADAVREKLKAQCRPAPNDFKIFGTNVTKMHDDTVLQIAATNLSSGKMRDFSMVIESDNRERQRRGQAELSSLCAAVGLMEIDDSDDLVGKIAAAQHTGDGYRFAAVPPRLWHDLPLAA